MQPTRRPACRTAFLCALSAGAPLLASCGGDESATSASDSGAGADTASTDDDGGAISCEGGAALCSGACVDTTSNSSHCGSCANACPGTAVCCTGVCVDDTPSCAFSITKIGPKQQVNQNGGDWITIVGSGFGPGLRVMIGDGAAPARAIDATHAIAQTPPAKVGSYDVTVLAGLQKATLPQALLYVAGDVELPWTEKPMSTVRGEDPALAVLQDGRVLVAGGTTVPDDASKALDTAEIYQRKDDSVTLAAGKMSVPRIHDGAITLLDGKVLVVGGAGWHATLGTPSTAVDLFDPSSNAFSPGLHPLNVARAGIRAVLLTDGRVLVTSGGNATAEIYDPGPQTFTTVPLLATHTWGFAVRLRDGRAMIGGGDGGVTACEIFDAAANKFVAAAPLVQGRSMLTAHTLPDGRVIVVGGASLSAGGVHVPLDQIELYDPKADKWTVAPYKLTTGRTWHAGALVRDGTVLAMGGYNVDGTCDPINTVDQIDPVKGTVKAFGALPHPNTEWTAVTLQDGSVLGVGGGACGTPTALPSLDFLPGKPNQQ